MIFCRGCGKELHETAISCPHCGAPQIVPTQSVQKPSGTLWLPVPSLVLGIIVVLALFDDSPWDSSQYAAAFFFSVSAIVLGIIGTATQERGRGMSITGIVLGTIGLLGIIGLAQN